VVLRIVERVIKSQMHSSKQRGETADRQGDAKKSGGKRERGGGGGPITLKQPSARAKRNDETRWRARNTKISVIEVRHGREGKSKSKSKAAVRRASCWCRAK
jgi:hypothetical protein